MTNWQQLPQGWGQRFLDTTKVIVRVPVIATLFVVSTCVGGFLIALAVKATIWLFREVIFKAW